MNCSTAFSMKMESKKMASKALEIMKSVLAQTDADGFNYDSRETFDRFADNLKVKGSEIIDTQSYGLMSETYHIVLPEMFKAVARCFCFDKFSSHIYFESTYWSEEFDIIYEDYLKVDIANSRLVMDRTFAKNCVIAGSAEYNQKASTQGR